MLKIHIMFHCRAGRQGAEWHTEHAVNTIGSPCGGTNCKHFTSSVETYRGDKQDKLLPDCSADCSPCLSNTSSLYRGVCPLFIPPVSVKASFEIIPHYIPVTGGMGTEPGSVKDETMDPAHRTVKADDRLDMEEPMDILSRSFVEFATKDGYMCIYCGKLYSRKYGLKIHLRTHTGYKPLKCKVCLRAFGDPSNLNKHVRLHSQGAAPYRCYHCGKVLVRRRDLARHLKSRHPHKV